jgi:hypothetical protein
MRKSGNAMREKVIIHPVLITKKGEIKSFQIKLPTDVKRIIGIESTVKGIDSLAVSRAIAPSPVSPPDPYSSGSAGGVFQFRMTALAGELRLQSRGPSNLFYNKDVKLSDANVGFGDFSLNSAWRAQAWSHGNKFYEDEVLVDDDSNVLSGTYRDKFGETLGHDFSYRVNVYVWYAIE